MYIFVKDHHRSPVAWTGSHRQGSSTRLTLKLPLGPLHNRLRSAIKGILRDASELFLWALKHTGSGVRVDE